MTTTITVILNGEHLTLASGTTLATLIASRGVDTRGTAVEIDGTVIPRSRWADTELHDGARIEWVHMVGGGA